MRTAVIVLGDLGRSPRMQYHAVSLAEGGEVDLIGLEGAAPIVAVSANPRIHVYQLADRSVSTRARGGTGRFVIASMFRAVRQAFRLWRVLMRVPKPDTILVQNPPAVPTLSVAWLVAKLRGARLVIDWHNLSHSVAAIRLGERHRAVRALARSERRWARRAGGHLAVMLLATDWPAFAADLPKELVKGACSIGGLFDMEAIRLSYLNKTLKMSKEEAARNAPLLQKYPVSAPLSLVVAVDETPEYHRQSEAMAELWRSLGYPVELLVPQGVNHFDVVNQLRDPACELVKVQLAEMRKAFRL